VRLLIALFTSIKRKQNNILNEIVMMGKISNVTIEDNGTSVEI
jgi:hypothetical protein